MGDNFDDLVNDFLNDSNKKSKKAGIKVKFFNLDELPEDIKGFVKEFLIELGDDIIGGVDDSTDIDKLKANLEEALDAEDYLEAAKIRDEISKLKE